MRNVPILDKQYMENRARMQYFTDYMKALKGTLSESPEPEKRPEDSVREDYLSGAISVEVFEARLNVIFGLKR